MCASDIIAFSALTTRKRARLSGKPPHPWVPYKVCRARAARRAAAGLKEGDSVFPWHRGVATPLIKCREATEKAQTGWSLTRKVTCERPEGKAVAKPPP